jgi:CarD family transcriptional regulator
VGIVDSDAGIGRRTRRARDVKLAVGDLVVYRSHGIGRVSARRKQECIGGTQEVVVLELEQLTVTLPLALAKTQLRPLANKADLRRVGFALRDDGKLSPGNWLARRRETLEKLVRGTPLDLAQIVSEGAQRDRLRSSGGKGQLSLSERQLYTRARALLADEVALARQIQPAAAETWIDARLARPS